MRETKRWLTIRKKKSMVRKMIMRSERVRVMDSK